MRIKGDNDLVFEVPDAVATSMIDAGHVHEVAGHAADEPESGEEPPAEGQRKGSRKSGA